MTTYHETSCTECEALKLGDCSTCDMSKWRTVQNLLAWFIAVEMIGALSLMVGYATFLGSATESFMRFGDTTYAAKLAGAMTFAGLVIIVTLRERITEWLLHWAEIMQSSVAEEPEDDEDDE